MKISPDHYLDVAVRRGIPGGNPMPTRRFLVIHFTGGWSGASAVDFWKTHAAKGANAHIVIDRDGSVIQCRAFNWTAGHAGVSKWKDPKTGIWYKGLNSCSIGIELANCGDLTRATYPATMPSEWAGQPIPRLNARHKNGGPIKEWEKYDHRQLDTLQDVSKLLVERYKLDDVVGHDDIAPDRKNDPGPAFPMNQFRAYLGFPPMTP